MAKKKRGKNVRRQRRLAVAESENNYSKVSHSFIFARSGAGPYVKTVARDIRRIFEPFTATRLKVSRSNVLKDFISIAGPLNVSHIMYFTHSNSLKNLSKHSKHKKVATDSFSTSIHDGKVYLHLIRSPQGPTFTFHVKSYCFSKDLTTLVQRSFSNVHFMQPPLLVMNGFSSQDDSKSRVLRLTVDLFQNMLPPFNVQTLKLKNVKRVLLLNREEDGLTGEEIISLRHYLIRTENKEISKPLRRLGLGGNVLRKKTTLGLGPGGVGRATGVPSLAKYSNIEDYLTKAGCLTDSGMSEIDEEQKDVELPCNEAESLKRKDLPGFKQGFTHLTCKKATIKLIELGPRLDLQLIKVEEGINDGDVLYHAYHKLTQEEIVNQIERKQSAKLAKEKLKQDSEVRRIINLQKREMLADIHKRACSKTKIDIEQEPALEEAASSQTQIPAKRVKFS